MVLQKGLRGASLREIKEDIKVLLLIRYKGRGFKLPRLVYSDMCCNDREVFMEIYEELRAMGLEMEVEDETPADVSLPRFMLPSDVKVRCAMAEDGDVLSSLCDEIRTQAAGNDGVVGFDIEWDIALSGAHENPPATFQLAAGKFVLILQILHGQKTPPAELPGSLVSLLEDASLTFTGVGINADCTRIEKFFGVKVAHAVDLAKLALIRKVPLGLKRGLADLCSHMLGRSLSKNGRVRLSRWNRKDLSEEQKT